MNIETVRQDWRNRGFSCDLWVDPPGQCWEGYVHATDELVMIVKGQVEFEIEGAIHRPDPGEELFALASLFMGKVAVDDCPGSDAWPDWSAMASTAGVYSVLSARCAAWRRSPAG